LRPFGGRQQAPFVVSQEIRCDFDVDEQDHGALLPLKALMAVQHGFR
jgi:hypothetical protein